MQIDIFTLAAQVINFLILLTLLYYFLYRPIMGVMTRREEEVQERLDDAENARQEAQAEADRLASKRRELESERHQRLDEAEEEASKRKETLLEDARQQVDATRQRWFDELQREHDAALHRLEEQLAEQLVDGLGRALDDLADSRLEDRIVQQFLDRLQHLEESDTDALQRGLRDGSAQAQVRTAFTPSSKRRNRLEEGLRSLLGDEVTIHFEQDPELKAGVELTVADHVVSWSVRDYLKNLDAALSLELERRRGEDADAGSEQERTGETEEETAHSGAEA